MYTDVVLFFFWIFSKTSVSARTSAEHLFFPSPHPTTLRWRSINPSGFSFFYHARSTDFEEKVEGL